MNTNVAVEAKVLPHDSVCDIEVISKEDCFTEHELVQAVQAKENSHVTKNSAPQDNNINIKDAAAFTGRQDGKEPTRPVLTRAMSDENRLRVQLTWKHVNVWPRDNEGCGPCRGGVADADKNYILHNVCGTVKPGQYLSIIGCSGAGKTTLLQLLSGKMFPQALTQSGDILINGRPRDNIDYSKFTAFVQQDDILMENMTIRESLQFAADVKSPGNFEHKQLRVALLMEELELLGCGELQFSNEKVSKGEKKRASIGVELITDPALVFVDEPTTGMDSCTATKIVGTLGKLASRGRTIIATIHQPSTDIFKSFDRLMILALG